jgi:antitoxin (DNA-binding transcriptional repressor) of toxin-antitoxin stability system
VPSQLISGVAPDATARYTGRMRRISQREFRNASAAVMDAVERGASFEITRHGAIVAELRPPTAEAFVHRAELKAAFAHLPAGGFHALREEADAIFGEDRLGG